MATMTNSMAIFYSCDFSCSSVKSKNLQYLLSADISVTKSESKLMRRAM
jgi:hypothetical protein